MRLLLLEVVIVRNFESTCCKSDKDPTLRWKVMRIGIKILFHVSFFTKILVRNITIIHYREEDIKEGKTPIHVNLRQEFDGVG